MSMTLAHIAGPFEFTWMQQVNMMNGTVGRLLMACLLGGLVGLEREANRKAAGVRTNLLICMGCAFFTLLSAVLAGDSNPDKGRVASNIVQGIGFLGAGLILHNRNRISGMTSAASVFAVASIGMACGAGLYGAAAAAALIVIVSLEAVGFLERRANLKKYPMFYETRGNDQELMMQSVLDAMDKTGQRLGAVDHDAVGELRRLSFALTATRKQHEHLRTELKVEPGIHAVMTFHDPEED